MRRALLVAGLTALPWSTIRAADDGPPAPPGVNEDVVHREEPDDAPGVPAAQRDGLRRRTIVPVRGTLFPAVQVNVDPGGNNIVGDAANEPSIAVDPTAPNRMAIGWRQFDTIQSNFRQAGCAWTNDGGRTWTSVGPLDAGIFRSDPVLGADANGRFYYNSLRSEFLCDFFISDDGGRTWSAPISAFGGDKAWIAVDTTPGIGFGNLYCSWSVFAGCCGLDAFTRSTDGGQSYTTPIELPERPIFGTVATGLDGEVYVAGIRAGNFGQFIVARSLSAQNPLVEPVFESFATIGLQGFMRLGAGPNPGGLLGQAWIAVDHSDGPTRGNLYLLCSVENQLLGDPLDVRLTRSTDNGQTWSPSIRVYVDPDRTWQWFGTMSIAPNGRIDVVWNDTRNSPGTTTSELYYASSSDGGLSFSESVALSVPWSHFVGYPQQDKIGDYYHMVSDHVGANLAFAATFNGEQDVYFLRIGDYDCNGNAVGDADDIAAGTSADCNANGIADECEIAAGSVEDANGNGIPDPCDIPGDIFGDGVVDALDWLLLLSQWGPCPPPGSPCPADLNLDTVVDALDLLLLIENWTQ